MVDQGGHNPFAIIENNLILDFKVDLFQYKSTSFLEGPSNLTFSDLSGLSRILRGFFLSHDDIAVMVVPGTPAPTDYSLSLGNQSSRESPSA